MKAHVETASAWNTTCSRIARRLFLAVVAIAGAFQALQVALAFFGDRRLVFTNWDFPAFYAAGKLVARGSGHLLYDIDAIRRVELEAVGHPVGGTGVLPFFNPAFFALPFAPLSTLDILSAYQAWTALSVLLLAVNVLIILRLTAGLSRPWRFGVAAAFVTLAPVSYGLQHGQFSLVLLTSWAAGFLLIRAGRERMGGAALSLLLIKPELLIPVALWLAWRRHWRAFETLVPLTVAAVLVSVAVTGVDAARRYPAFLLESTRWEGQGVTTLVMFGWNGFVAMFLHEPAAPSTRAVVLVLMAVTLVAGLLVGRRRGSQDDHLFAAQWLVITIVTVLVDPHFYLQDTILLALPAVALLAGARAEQRGVMALVFAGGWCTLALGTAPNQYLHVNLFAVYMVVVGGAVALPFLRREVLLLRGAVPPEPMPRALTLSNPGP